jgi:DDE superfamily endonuclease
VSTDELTGVQALERKHPGLPLAPGKVERREFEYVRHGTRSFILSRDVVTGHLLAPACGPTRTEADFLAHLQALVATQPEATRFHVVCDQLNTHQSASLVRLSSLTCRVSKRIWASKARAASWPRWPAARPFSLIPVIR